MATKAQPVPWPEVVDLRDDLFEWLVRNEHADKDDTPQVTAWKVLETMPSDDSPPSRVAWALHDIEMYRAAGRREDLAAEAATRSKISESVAPLLHDDSVEKQTEATIRGLLPRIAQIRQLITKVAERKRQRRQRVPLAPHVLEWTEQNEDAKLAALRADLDGVTHAVEKLHEGFQDFNPAATSHPLTLSDWRSLEKEIRNSLKEVGVDPSK